MRILLTNDDGIRAPGIVAMHEALTDEAALARGEMPDPPGLATRAPRHVVHTVAPLTVQSATSHGVTFHEPLMVRTERVTTRFQGVAVDARPADCVKLAIACLWPERFGAGDRPDLVVSGLNAGANCGINVLYSGTVAAAIEAAFLGVPSIAVSLRLDSGTPDFERAAFLARRTIWSLVARGLPRAHECLSINIPTTQVGAPAGEPPVVVCPMNTHGLVDQYERRESPSRDVYYWASGHGLDFRGTEPGSDVDHLLRGAITVTPLTYDLTAHARLEQWRGRLSSV